jgi:hypothetical protein
MSDAAVDDTSRSAASVPEFPHQAWFAVASAPRFLLAEPPISRRVDAARRPERTSPADVRSWSPELSVWGSLREGRPRRPEVPFGRVTARFAAVIPRWRYGAPPTGTSVAVPTALWPRVLGHPVATGV